MCAADRDGVLGAKHSNSRSYCEHLQRSRPPETADAHGAVIRAEVPWVAVGRVVPMQRGAKHPHAAHAVAQRNLADLRAVEGKGFGGAHGLEFSGAACF